jgi:hypothetical protein
MLKLRPNRGCGDKGLAPEAADAMICTSKCTVCAAKRLPQEQPRSAV